MSVDLVAVDHLALALDDAGVQTSIDPAAVRTPGGWLKHAGLSICDTLAGGNTHQLQLHLVVADNGYLRSRNALFELLDQAMTVWTPDGAPFFQGLQLPGGKPLPGLVVPIDLPDDFRHEPQE